MLISKLKFVTILMLKCAQQVLTISLGRGHIHFLLISLSFFLVSILDCTVSTVVEFVP